MADLVTVYTLTTPGGTVHFNNGQLRTTTDLYWIENIRGLDSPSLRTPIDDAPQAHGAILHRFWKGARHIQFEGIIIIQSVPFGDLCQSILNSMEAALRTALESILQTNGTLSWTPLNQSAKSLSVRYEIPLEISPSNNYMTRTFSFGLIAANPDY